MADQSLLRTLLFPLIVTALVTVITLPGCKSDSSGSDQPSSGSAAVSSTANSSALFKLLSPEESGVDFVNHINEQTSLHYYVYGYLYNGGGVAVGDINQDGLPDLYFSGTMVPNRLYLNKGGLKFEDITQSAGLIEPGQGLKTGVAMADINADGLLDIFVSRSGSLKHELRSNLVYINQGNQTFKEMGKEMGLGDPCNTNQAAFFDMDGDGDLDCYMMNHPTRFGENSRPRLKPTLDGGYERITTPLTDFESDRLYRNNSDGTFTNVSKSSGINNSAFGLSITIADFNQDNYPDIFVANDFVEPDFLYINDGKGRFTDQYDRFFRHISQNSMGSDLADLNNDGLADLMVLDMLPDDPYRQKEMMSTMMLDRVNTLYESGYGKQQMRNVLQANNGDGSFSEIGQLAGVQASDWSWAPVLADLDNDGLKDIYITNGYLRDVTDLDFLKFRNDSLRKKDLTMEDLPALLSKIPQSKLRNHLYHNLGDFNFEEIGASWGTSQATFSNGAVAADLDRDGDLELIVNNIADPVSIYKNAGREGNNFLQLKLNGPAKNPFSTGAEAWVYTSGNVQYQLLNPVRGYFSSQEPLLHFGLGKAATADSVKVRWPDGSTLHVSDIAGGGHELNYADAVKSESGFKPVKKGLMSAADKGISFTHQENDFEDFKREFLLPRRLSREGPCMTTGDVNGDGTTDLFIGGAAGQAGEIFVQDGRGNFKVGARLSNAESEDVAASFLDANGDGSLDLYVVSGGYAFKDGDRRYQDRLYLNDGNGNFTVTIQAIKNEPGGSIAAQDWDGDGDIDIFVGGFAKPGSYPFSTRSYLFQNDGGKFTDVTSAIAPDLMELGIINDARWADLDKDGSLELIVCGEWKPISVFKFAAGKFSNVSSKFGLGDLTGWWNSLTFFDADKDGDLDLLAGNLGRNTRFNASPSEPLTLYAKDFDGNGSVDPVLFHYERGQLRPWASKDLLLSQLPGLKKNFLRYTKYAQADLNAIFSSSERQDALELKCAELENSLFINEQGRFVKKSLPLMAQAFPVQDAIAGDFNEDGKADLLLVGNNYHMDIEMGPITAGHGLILVGDGAGKFTALSALDAGLNAVGDARSVESIPLSGGKWLYVIGMNDGKTATFIR